MKKINIWKQCLAMWLLVGVLVASESKTNTNEIDSSKPNVFLLGGILNHKVFNKNKNEDKNKNKSSLIPNPLTIDTKKYNVWCVLQSFCGIAISEGPFKKTTNIDARFVNVPHLHDKNTIVQKIKAIKQEHKLTGEFHIIPNASEGLIKLAAEVRDELKKVENISIPLGMTSEQADYYVNKGVMKKKMQDKGVPTAPFIDLGISKDVTPEIITQTGGFKKVKKFVFKPKDGEGSKGIDIVKKGDLGSYLARNKKKLKGSSKDKLDGYLVEPFVDYECIYDVNGIIRNGKIKLVTFTKIRGNCFNFYREKKPFGLFVEQDSKIKEELFEIANKCLQAGAYKNGPFRIEIMKLKKKKENSEENKYYVIEPAARRSGDPDAIFLDYCGINLPQAALNVQLGLEMGVKKENIVENEELEKNCFEPKWPEDKTLGIILIPIQKQTHWFSLLLNKCGLLFSWIVDITPFEKIRQGCAQNIIGFYDDRYNLLLSNNDVRSFPSCYSFCIHVFVEADKLENVEKAFQYIEQNFYIESLPIDSVKKAILLPYVILTNLSLQSIILFSIVVFLWIQRERVKDFVNEYIMPLFEEGYDLLNEDEEEGDDDYPDWDY